MLTGHISSEWGRIFTQTTNTQVTETIWTAAMVEGLLLQMQKLWEQRNSDMHGKSAAEQKMKALERLRRVANNLCLLKDKCLGRDHWIFPQDSEELHQLSVKDLETWILTRKPVMLRSIQKAKIRDTTKVSSITKWFPPVATTNPTKSRVCSGYRDTLRYDPFSKKKKNRKKHCHQSGVKRYLSLRTSL